MEFRTQKHKKYDTKDREGKATGYLVPLYNVHDGFLPEPKQVYLSVMAPGGRKGPHMHKIRSGFVTCIKGNVKVVLKGPDGYKEYFSGEEHEYLSVEMPPNTPVMYFNLGPGEAFLINMPSPAWTPDMNDDYTADFSDYLQALP